MGLNEVEKLHSLLVQDAQRGNVVENMTGHWGYIKQNGQSLT